MIDSILNKFGVAAMPPAPGYHRVTVKVTGDSASWTTFTSAGALGNVQEALTANGIGFENIFYNTVFAIDPFAFAFTVVVIAPDGQTDEQVLQLVLASIAGTISNPVATIVSGDVAAAQNQSLGQTLSNAASDVGKAILPTTAVGQVSSGVLIVAAAAAGLFILSKSSRYA